jgi:hypothetical protein
LLFELHNKASIAFTHIALAKPQMSEHQGITPFVPLSYLAPGGRANAHVSLELGGARTPVRFLFATDRGAFPAEIRPLMGEMLRPAPLSAPQFDATRARLAGMCESSTKLRAPHEGADARTSALMLAPALLQHMNAALVTAPSEEPNGVGGSTMAPLTAVRLSATALVDGRRVLAAIDVLADGSLRLAVHAEDAISGNILLVELKVALSA